MYCQRPLVADLMPVDMVINLMCAVAPATARGTHLERGKETPIYNCTSGSKNPITWRDVETMATIHILQNPMHKMFW